MTMPYEEAAETRRLVTPAAEALLGKKFQCLDHGFIYLVDYMGGDASIVQAARVSYGIGTKSVNEDRGLIRYLMRHQHTTPLEMVEMKFHVKLPIFVARQWIRHRTACLSGDSELIFDLPGAQRRGRRQCHRVAIEKFHKLWHEGTTHPMRKRLEKMHLRTCDEQTGEICHTRVVDVWCTGEKLVFRVVLENGSTLKMTENHRCMTEKGWMTLKEATGLRLQPGNGVTWNADSPMFAVNGMAAYKDRDWLAAQRASGLMPRPVGKRTPRGRKLVRAFSKIARIEYVGEETTYDLQVSGPYHNFVANGFVVHNSVNEYSGRYSIMPDEFYLPEIGHITKQSATNRQGGGESLDAERQREIRLLIEQEQGVVREGYERMLELEVRRELARVNLGVSQYTEWYWKCDLHNIFHFLKLRLDDHAQYEIRVYAEAMAEIVRAVAPVAYEAFVDYSLEAERFSRLELETLARLLRAGEGKSASSADELADVLPEAWRERNAEGALKRNRERDEFLAKLERLLGE
jgi:flavin-dependent thymidylate synthase